MKKVPPEYLNKLVICPKCKNERRQGEMMTGSIDKMCKYCYVEERKNESEKI